MIINLKFDCFGVAAYAVVQSQNTVSAYFTTKHMLPFGFSLQYMSRVYRVPCATFSDASPAYGLNRFNVTCLLVSYDTVTDSRKL